MEKIIFFGIYGGLVVLIGLGIILFHFILSTRGKKSEEKLMPYESGMDPFHSSRVRVPIKFYVYAMAFLIFDVEVALLLPFVPVSKSTGILGIFSVLSFIIILFVAYVYLRRILIEERGGKVI